MKNPIFDRIIRAIDGHCLLQVTDVAGPRLVEPYLVFESAQGDMLLHCWQRSGAYRHTPPPRWCNLHLDDIEAVEILPARFEQPHPGFNPDAAQFHRVLYACDRGATAFEGAPPKARVRPARRGPPESRTSRPAPRPPRRR